MATKTRLVWIERRALLDFVGKGREFPFVVHTKLSKYVNNRREEFVQMKVTVEYDPHNGRVMGCRFSSKRRSGKS